MSETITRHETGTVIRVTDPDINTGSLGEIVDDQGGWYRVRMVGHAAAGLYRHEHVEVVQDAAEAQELRIALRAQRVASYKNYVDSAIESGDDQEVVESLREGLAQATRALVEALQELAKINASTALYAAEQHLAAGPGPIPEFHQFVEWMSNPVNFAAPERKPELAEDVQAGQRLAAVDGLPLHEGDLPGLLVESVRLANDGDVVLTVWGTSRMIEIRVTAGTEVSTVEALDGDDRGVASGSARRRPSGVPCENCSELHASQPAEDACILEAELEELPWFGPQGTNSDILSLVQPTKLMRLVEGFHDGKVDAAEVRAAIREAR